MSTKPKSITELVTELQEENESLQSLKKLFNQACKNEFGQDVKEIHQSLAKLKALEAHQAEKPVQQVTFSQREM